MKFLTAVSTALLALVAAKPIKRQTVPAFDYQNDKVRGLNLGGWFLIEPFITPSLFTGNFDSAHIPLDEYHFTLSLGKEKAQEILSNHWDTWITEEDFKQISEYGFNTVRIPIGYWAFIDRPQDPYVQGQEEYLDKAIEWARTYGLKVWVDLHGVPGGQNGFDNSGIRDVLLWQDERYPENIEDSKTAFKAIVDKYGGSNYEDVISGLEAVNEPLGTVLSMDKIHDYYADSYNKVRDKGYNAYVAHDAFQQIGFFNEWFQLPAYNVVLDHHHYQVFSVGELQRSIDEHVEYACELGRDYAKENLWHVVGEFSSALTDCTPLLNGVYRGARYDATFQSDTYLGSCEGINDVSTWSDQKKQDTRRYVEAQLDAYEQAGGWIFWTYKTEDTVEWDVRQLINNGLFPQPITDRWYPNQCGF